MDLLASTQGLLQLLLLIGALALKGFAFAHSLTVPTSHYPAAGKQTKPLWAIMLGATLAAQIVVLNPLNLVNLLGVVAAAVYVVDVRPAVKQIGGRGNSRNQGPYGPW